MRPDPHADAVIDRFGPAPADAAHTVVILHGRGASAQDMGALAARLEMPDIAWIAPTAGGRSWWPTSFLVPHKQLEPFLSSALRVVASCIAQAREEGADPARLTVMGFSQGACLALEYAARADHPLHSVAGLSGGLLGTGDGQGAPSEDLYGHAPKAFEYAADRSGTVAYLGCHERDPFIPIARVRESAAALNQLGATVTTHVFDGEGHSVTPYAIAFLRAMLSRG